MIAAAVPAHEGVGLMALRGFIDDYQLPGADILRSLSSSLPRSTDFRAAGTWARLR